MNDAALARRAGHRRRQIAAAAADRRRADSEAGANKALGDAGDRQANR